MNDDKLLTLPRRPGRPRKAVEPPPDHPTDEQARIMLEALQRGCSRSHAAAQAGAGRKLLELWLQDDEFELRVLQAESVLQEQALAGVMAGGRSWTNWAWMLERRFAATYARQFEVSATERAKFAKQNGLLIAETVMAALAEAGLSTEQQEAIRGALAKALEKVTA